MKNVVTLRDMYSFERGFRDPDPQVRIAAIQHAGQRLESDGRLHEWVVERLKDADPRVARYAAVTLAGTGDAVGVAFLLAAIKTAKGASQQKDLDVCLRQCTRFPCAILLNELIHVDSIVQVADSQLRVFLEEILEVPAQRFNGKSEQRKRYREHAVSVLTRGHSIEGVQLRDAGLGCIQGLMLLLPSGDRPGFVCSQPDGMLYEFGVERVINRPFCEVGREVLFVCSTGQCLDRCRIVYVLEDAVPRPSDEARELLATCSAKTYFQRGEEFAADGQWDEAIGAYTNAIGHREEARSYLGRGYAHTKKGAWQRAIEDFEHTLRIDPSNRAARENLAWPRNVMAIFDPERSPDIPIEVRIAAADALGRSGEPWIDFSLADLYFSERAFHHLDPLVRIAAIHTRRRRIGDVRLRTSSRPCASSPRTERPARISNRRGMSRRSSITISWLSCTPLFPACRKAILDPDGGLLFPEWARIPC